MNIFSLTRIAIAFLTCFIIVSGVSANPALQTSPPMINLESPENLKTSLDELLGFVAAGDSHNISLEISALAIPNHKEWFLQTFGPAEGPRLESKYVELQPQSAEWVKNRIEGCIKRKQTGLTVKLIQKPDDPIMPLLRVTLISMAQPTTIYNVTCSANPDDKNANYLGEFIYIDDGFRYLDRQVLQALSTAPAMRIRIGGNVQRAKLVSQVQPNYPPEARHDHIQGTVKLHVILAKDGTVASLEAVNGNPALTPAALEAVRQWRYQPTLLNGQPVEVDTEIDVIFQLKN